MNSLNILQNYLDNDCKNEIVSKANSMLDILILQAENLLDNYQKVTKECGQFKQEKILS